MAHRRNRRERSALVRVAAVLARVVLVVLVAVAAGYAFYLAYALASPIVDSLAEGEGRVCVFENYLARRTDPQLSRAESRTLFFGDEVYHLVAGERAGHDEVRAAIREAGNPTIDLRRCLIDAAAELPARLRGQRAFGGPKAHAGRERKQSWSEPTMGRVTLSHFPANYATITPARVRDKS